MALFTPVQLAAIAEGRCAQCTLIADTAKSCLVRIEKGVGMLIIACHGCLIDDVNTAQDAVSKIISPEFT